MCKYKESDSVIGINEGLDYIVYYNTFGSKI